MLQGYACWRGLRRRNFREDIQELLEGVEEMASPGRGDAVGGDGVQDDPKGLLGFVLRGGAGEWEGSAGTAFGLADFAPGGTVQAGGLTVVAGGLAA